MISEPISVVACLMAVLALLFSIASHPTLSRIYKIVPMLVFAYFVPTLLSNVGVLPVQSPAYAFIKKTLLPASLILLTLSVDIRAIAKLGPKMLACFFGASASVLIGGPIAYLCLGWLIPEPLRDEAWKGLAALCGSWIGGGANFVAIGESVQASQSMMGLIVIVDVAVSGLWMAILFFFAGRERTMDERIGADRKALDELRHKVEHYQAEITRPANVADYFLLLTLGIGGTVAATFGAHYLPDLGTVINGFTWVVLIVTAFGVSLSLTRVRRLEGVGASKLGTVFLYLLIATIGAQGDFRSIVNAPALVAVGALWMLIHAVIIWFTRKWLKAPIFFLAVGSQANIGAAASAPIVASAFHPALAPVGVLLSILGYVLGTYLGVLCAFMLERINAWLVF